ncbi:MAG: DUF3575 domain-containing protein [Rikenellaceae bacterium]
MPRKITIALIVLLSTFSAQSQTYLRSNALYLAVLMPNIGVETRLSDNFTFEGEVNVSLWKNLGKNKIPMQFVQYIVGARWYPKGVYNGFYTGGDFSFDLYNMNRWNYWKGNVAENGIKVQHGYGYYLGATIGYEMKLSERWLIDFYVGGGWHLGTYWGERVFEDKPSEMYVSWNKSGEWLPYKIGVTFGYKL